jgi:hypothetical protein
MPKPPDTDPDKDKEESKNLAFVIFLVFLPSIIASCLILYGLFYIIRALIRYIKRKAEAK